MLLFPDSCWPWLVSWALETSREATMESFIPGSSRTSSVRAVLSSLLARGSCGDGDWGQSLLLCLGPFPAPSSARGHLDATGWVLIGSLEGKGTLGRKQGAAQAVPGWSCRASWTREETLHGAKPSTRGAGESEASQGPKAGGPSAPVTAPANCPAQGLSLLHSNNPFFFFTKGYSRVQRRTAQELRGA